MLIESVPFWPYGRSLGYAVVPMVARAFPHGYGHSGAYLNDPNGIKAFPLAHDHYVDPQDHARDCLCKVNFLAIAWLVGSTIEVSKN